MALGTGAILSVLIPQVLILAPWLALSLFAVYQYYAYRYFFGNRRGDFEFAYRKYIIEKMIRNSVRYNYGTLGLLRYLLNSLNQISSYGDTYLLELLTHLRPWCNVNAPFAILVKLAEEASKNDDLGKEKQYLVKALELKPQDFVVHFMLGVAYEKAGMGEEAIAHYRAGLTDPEAPSDSLKNL